jgi:hypothetical protein
LDYLSDARAALAGVVCDIILVDPEVKLALGVLLTVSSPASVTDTGKLKQDEQNDN